MKTSARLIAKRLWKMLPFVSPVLILVGCEDPTLPVPFQPSYVQVLPSWSKDGTSIAFVGTFQNVSGIYLVDTAGTSVHLLHTGNPTGMTWSADSKSLVYAENFNLYKFDIGGTSVDTLTSSEEDMYPAWSPDGRTIAFSRYGLGVYLYTFHSAQTTSAFASGDFPSWHTNGELVMLVQIGQSESGNAYSFYAGSVDSLHWRILLTFFAPGVCNYPSVSPAGLTEQEIVFSLSPGAGYSQIWKVNLSTGFMTQLTDDGADFPCWSPDGTKLVYTRTQKGDGGLWIMNADGSGKHRLTSPT